MRKIETISIEIELQIMNDEAMCIDNINDYQTVAERILSVLQKLLTKRETAYFCTEELECRFGL
jgi:hypothetical protein